jgi:MoxR-like ATPase
LVELDVETVSEICKKIQGELSTAIVGKEQVLRKLLLAVLANSHVLIEDYPGLAKTLIAKSLAATMGCKFSRVQFTPDLLPADITGTYVYNQKTGDFELRKGPVFTNILLADEINRSPPKTQAALLEAMQERQTTLDGKLHSLENPFIVLATQNPIEFEGVYQLPEAQIDRFIMKLAIGYPSEREEVTILRNRIERQNDDFAIRKVVDAETVTNMQNAIEAVHADDDLLGYISQVVRETRLHSQVEVGASPRGSLALLKLARANAALSARDYIIPDDVKAVAIEAISHRIIPKSSTWVRGFDPKLIIEEILNRVPVPRVD